MGFFVRRPLNEEFSVFTLRPSWASELREFLSGVLRTVPKVQDRYFLHNTDAFP